MRFSSVASPEAREAARRISQTRANERALALAPIIAEIQASGITTPYAIAAALTARGVPTAWGRRFWFPAPVRKILSRLDRLAAHGQLPTKQGGSNSP
jgi:hypothetical protein